MPRIVLYELRILRRHDEVDLDKCKLLITPYNNTVQQTLASAEVACENGGVQYKHKPPWKWKSIPPFFVDSIDMTILASLHAFVHE